MQSQPDVVGAIFFACGALMMTALTICPSLWVTLFIRRGTARRHFARSAGILRILPALGVGLCLLMSVVMLHG